MPVTVVIHQADTSEQLKILLVQVVAALHSLGAGELADSELRKIERQVTVAAR